MKKKTLVLALTFAMVAAITACGKTSQTDSEVADASQEVIVDSEEVIVDENEEDSESDAGTMDIASVIARDLELYDSVISELKPGEAYGLVAICENYDVLLVSKDGTYDWEGDRAAISAIVYGLDENNNVIELGEVNTGSTAYPLSVIDGYLLVGNNAGVYMYYVDSETNMLTTRKTAQVYYEDGVPSYYYSDVDTGFEGLWEDDSKLMELYGLYEEAFTVYFRDVE